MKQLLWSTGLKTVDVAKRRLKQSRLVRSMPLAHYTYLFDMPKAIVVPELGLVFSPTPKAANRSMKAAIASRLGRPPTADPHAGWQYAPVALMRQNDFFRFGFVRNPLDRLLSCYAQKIVLYGRQRHMPLEFWRYGRRFRPDMSFEEFVHEVARIPDRLSDIHFRSQHTFFYHNNRLMADFVGRYEQLDRDWSVVAERFALPPLPHYNRSDHTDYRDSYTPELARVAARRYQDDIERFGYRDSIDTLLNASR